MKPEQTELGPVGAFLLESSGISYNIQHTTYDHTRSLAA